MPNPTNLADMVPSWFTDARTRLAGRALPSPPLMADLPESPGDVTSAGRRRKVAG